VLRESHPAACVDAGELHGDPEALARPHGLFMRSTRRLTATGVLMLPSRYLRDVPTPSYASDSTRFSMSATLLVPMDHVSTLGKLA